MLRMHGRLLKWLRLACPLVLAACNAAAPGIVDSGPLRCVIERKGYGAGVLNPADSCQICNPSLETSAWTSQPDLTDCSGSDAGTFCQLGECVDGCGIDGLVILAGVTNPDDACQVCVPTEALGGWSLKPGNPDCGDAGTPDAGAPDAGTPDAGPPDAGTPDAGLDAGTCVIDGTPCDAGGSVCVAGACLPGCYIDQALVPPHQFQSETQDACCNPALSVGSWTPGFIALPAIAIAGVSVVASAAVTTSNAQLIVGTSAGALDLLTRLPDSGFAQSSVVTGAAAITAVAAVDVTGDGLVDLLYVDSTSPTLLAQNAGRAFDAPKSWPRIHDGGGVWAEKSIYGPQVLSFDLAYAPNFSTSSLQPQVDASGQLLDSCPAAVDYCTPTGLAFGSIREVGGVEFVMTCDMGIFAETLYGEFIPGLCGDAGWLVNRLPGAQFGVGAVYGLVVAAGDLNGDGYSEVVGGGEQQGIGLLMNLGPDFGYFVDSPTPLPLPGGANVTSLQIANLRGDAGGGIIALDVGNSTLDVFYPPPPYDAGVALTASYPLAARSVALAVGDFNADGRPDVAVANANGVQVFQRQCP